MRIIRLTTGLIIIAGALYGIFGLMNQDVLLNKVIGIMLFSTPLLIGIFVLIKQWRAMYKYIQLLFVLQIIAIKGGAVNFLFASIGSIVMYFPIGSSGSNIYFFSLPYFELISNERYEGLLMGVNILAVLCIIVVWLIGKSPGSIEKN